MKTIIRIYSCVKSPLKAFFLLFKKIKEIKSNAQNHYMGGNGSGLGIGSINIRTRSIVKKPISAPYPSPNRNPSDHWNNSSEP